MDGQTLRARTSGAIALLALALSLSACTRPTPVVAAWSETWLRDVRCPIVMYHQVNDDTPDQRPGKQALHCSMDRFLEHLLALTGTGYETVTFEELDAGLNGRRPLPERPVVLTFDDGTEDHWEVSRILLRHGMKGVFFISPARCGRPGYLTRAQVRALHDEGMEIGDHTWSHRILRELTWDGKVAEVMKAQQALDGLLGAPVKSFAYPGGVFDPESIQLLRRCGFRFARTTLSGVAQTAVPNLALPCVHAHEQTTGQELVRLLVATQPEICRVCRTGTMPLYPAEG